MKARSVIFPQTQGPFRIFGMSPILVGVSIAATMVSFVVCMALGVLGLKAFTMLSVIVAALVCIGCLTVTYRISKSDLHVETVWATCRRFWRSSPCRCLQAGAYPRRSRRGRS